MSGPSVVVDWAPEGWTHIGGPGMHLLIGLDEDDEQTLVASDAADGGDLDDVLEVLTTGGMRKARHFVGVHWQPRTRLVAFGPVAATVTAADGSEHEVRATSTRVWTDVELPEHPTHVRLRVLDEAEAAESPPPVTLGAAAVSAPAGPPDGSVTDQPYAVGAPTAATPHLEQAPSTQPVGVESAEVEQAGLEPAGVAQPEAPAAPAPQQDAPAMTRRPVPVVPTFGGSVAPDSPTTSPWQRSWAQHSPSAVSAGSTASTTPAHVEPSVPEPVAPEPVAPEPVGSMPEEAAPATVAAPESIDVESTLSARPVPDRLPDPAPAPVVATTDAIDTGTPGAGGDEAVPSYDYLFGHTTTADEHRRVLAELERPAEDDQDDELPAEQFDGGGHTDAAAAPAPLATSPAAAQGDSVGSSAPPSSGAASPEEGGLISSVPWARPAATAAPTAPTLPTVPADPGPAPGVPTFAGRHTPPPAPSLLPPAIAAPPGARPAPSAPIITTGPPLPTPAVTPPPPATSPVTGPAPAVGPTDAVAAVADAEVVADDEAELTVDRSALIQAREAARSRVSTGPSVLAVLCSSGHPTPPHGERCRVCGSGIPPQEPFAMPRPPLGVLRLSTGDVVTLDRSVLLGRAPRLSESHSAADRPHVVKVPSPERDVSRNHVEVVLEGWHVLIRDLGTTNGTTVSLPGETPVRLRANDQQVLEAGSLVSMADEISFVFEAAP